MRPRKAKGYHTHRTRRHGQGCVVVRSPSARSRRLRHSWRFLEGVFLPSLVKKVIQPLIFHRFLNPSWFIQCVSCRRTEKYENLAILGHNHDNLPRFCRTCVRILPPLLLSARSDFLAKQMRIRQARDNPRTRN